MTRRTPIYGLDIETDTTVDGLDPAVARILTVAVSSNEVDELFTGAEPDLLAELDARLASLAPGVIATWNGAAFDLPFIADRAAMHRTPLGLRLEHDPSIVVRGRNLPGHRGAYRAAWHHHAHLDAFRVYRCDVGPALRISCGLKSIARFVGLPVVEVDREQIHGLSQEALHAYASSDARLARVLTQRRWATARRAIDRDPLTPTPAVDHTRRLEAMQAPTDRQVSAAQPRVEVGGELGPRQNEPPPSGPIAEAG